MVETAAIGATSEAEEDDFGVSMVLPISLAAAADAVTNGLEMHNGGGVLLLMSGGGEVIVCLVDLCTTPLLGKQLPVTAVGVVNVWASVVMKFDGSVVVVLLLLLVVVK